MKYYLIGFVFILAFFSIDFYAYHAKYVVPYDNLISNLGEVENDANKVGCQINTRKDVTNLMYSRYAPCTPVNYYLYGDGLFALIILIFYGVFPTVYRFLLWTFRIFLPILPEYLKDSKNIFFTAISLAFFKIIYIWFFIQNAWVDSNLGILYWIISALCILFSILFLYLNKEQIKSNLGKLFLLVIFSSYEILFLIIFSVMDTLNRLQD